MAQGQFTEGFAAPQLVVAGPSTAVVLASAAVQEPRPRTLAPSVEAYQRGSLDEARRIAADPQLRASAVAHTQARIYAATSRGPREAKLNVWRELSETAGYQADQLSVPQLIEITSILIKAKYRAAISYADVAKREFVRAGGHWTEVHAITRSDLRHAAARGLGPPSRAAPFPLYKLGTPTAGPRPLHQDGPCCPHVTCAISCWWLLREVEAAAVALSDVTFLSAAEASLRLAVSKSDPAAVGVSRALSCVCHKHSTVPVLPSVLCPVCLLRFQLNWVTDAFQVAAADNFPLFPTARGRYPSKAGMVATIEAMAKLLDESPVTRSGTARWGGHAWRRGGAWLLYGAGASALDVGRHARHSSSAIVAYLDGCDRSLARRQYESVALVPGAIDLLSRLAPVAATVVTPPPSEPVVDHSAVFVRAKRKGAKVHYIDGENQQRHCVAGHGPR